MRWVALSFWFANVLPVCNLRVHCFVICAENVTKCGNTFLHVIQKYTKFANFTGLYFQFLRPKYFVKFRILFPVVLIFNFLILKFVYNKRMVPSHLF